MKLLKKTNGVILSFFCLTFIAPKLFSQIPFRALENIANYSYDGKDFDEVVKYYRFYKPDSAAYYANIAIGIYNKQKDYQVLGNMFNHLGIINENQGAITEAEQKYKQAISYFKSVNFQPGIADELNRLGVLQLRKSNYTTATNFFLEALEIYDKLSLSSGIAECYLKLGAVHERQNDYDVALNYIQKADSINTQLPFSVLTLSTYNALGSIYSKKICSQKLFVIMKMVLS
ncbi:tetratricopeptide repeat protein [Niabella ginsengisoli]|uniref:Tetratricopeptide repeat protein n=1 Tax=Niabella ginsengisoli TaxID=522298 RepID=A0ABS9SIY5_9BACT|nr:tetratricopeptide repeat protein [Niabella ginsengisoli]MCH5598285.1 tetratricopeptide repeat protein [Niabella ginsengisoli]